MIRTTKTVTIREYSDLGDLVKETVTETVDDGVAGCGNWTYNCPTTCPWYPHTYNITTMRSGAAGTISTSSSSTTAETFTGEGSVIE